MGCIKIFPYEDSTDFSKLQAFTADESVDEEGFEFAEWEDYVIGYWFAVTDNGWCLAESIEEAIIEAFDMLDLPFDEKDLDILYELEEGQ